MAIYNIFDYYEKESAEKIFERVAPQIDPNAFTSNRIDESYLATSQESKGQFFSALAARFFFFLLLIADLIWGIWNVCLFSVKMALCLLTFGQVSFLTKTLAKSWLSLKRSIVCFIALFVAIFSPALGIMFSCMYFLMYDRSGVDEVVPASLRDQFRDLFPLG
jgi:hypothetical protein